MQLTTLYATILEKLPNSSDPERETICKEITDSLYIKLVGNLDQDKQSALQSLINEGLTGPELIDYFQSMPHFSELLQSVTDEIISNHTQNPA